MANPSHFAKLKEGVKTWNQWRIDERREQIIFRVQEALKGKEAEEPSDFYNDFTRRDLRSVNLSHADFTDVDFGSTDLRGANLAGANLSGANFFGAYLRRTNLAGANLSEARFEETIFANTCLASVQGLELCRHKSPSNLDFETIKISTPLPLAFLRGCGLSEKLIEYLPSLLEEAVQFYSCFISYSHADQAFARALHDTLQAQGIRCWLDEKQLLPGDDIYASIDRGIRLWDKFLLCCSVNSLKLASWVDKEIVTVLEKEDQITRRRGVKVLALIPLDLDGYLFSDDWKSGYRAEIRRRLTADFTHWDKDREKFEAQVKKVLGALRADNDVRARPPQARL